MLNKITVFFNKYILTASDDTTTIQHKLNVAIAALLIEMQLIDNHATPQEIAELQKILVRDYQLSKEETDQLVDLAQQELNNATDYYQFTSLINQHFDFQQKLNMLKQLWKLAMADGKLDSHEEHYVRKIADLLFIPHSSFIRAKLDIIDK